MFQYKQWHKNCFNQLYRLRLISSDRICFQLRWSILQLFFLFLQWKWFYICSKAANRITQQSNYKTLYTLCGPDSIVDIASGYGLDGPRIISRWRRDFPHLSRPALGPTQPPVQ
jgi:hypothetical protein